MGKPPTALHIREAERLGHNGIGCEHLLLGILANQDGPAARVLARHGVTLERARRRTGEMIGDGWQESVRWSYSPRATVVRRLAEVEAERLTHDLAVRARLIALACPRASETEEALRRERWTLAKLAGEVGMSVSRAQAILACVAAAVALAQVVRRAGTSGSARAAATRRR